MTAFDSSRDIEFVTDRAWDAYARSIERRDREVFGSSDGALTITRRANFTHIVEIQPDRKGMLVRDGWREAMGGWVQLNGHCWRYEFPWGDFIDDERKANLRQGRQQYTAWRPGIGEGGGAGFLRGDSTFARLMQYVVIDWRMHTQAVTT